MNILEIGTQTISLPSKQITQDDVVFFSEITGDKNRIHLDKEYAAKTSYHGTIVHGLLSVSILLGLIYKAGLFENLLTIFSEINNVKFEYPVYPLDTISGRVKTIGSYESYKKDGYFVNLAIEGIILNKNSIIFLRMETKFKVKKNGGMSS